jgi:hypothetical protein
MQFKVQVFYFVCCTWFDNFDASFELMISEIITSASPEHFLTLFFV